MKPKTPKKTEISPPVDRQDPALLTAPWDDVQMTDVVLDHLDTNPKTLPGDKEGGFFWRASRKNLTCLELDTSHGKFEIWVRKLDVPALAPAKERCTSHDPYCVIAPSEGRCILDQGHAGKHQWGPEE